jgi:hypothetical protein
VDPLQYLFEQAQPYWKEDYGLYNEEESGDDVSSSSPEIVIVQVCVKVTLLTFFAHLCLCLFCLSLRMMMTTKLMEMT